MCWKLLRQIGELQQEIGSIERSILACHRSSEVSQRLEKIPGVGIITATAIAATVSDAKVFEPGRHFAAWVGLTPRQSGIGGKVHLGKISKKGEAYLRRLVLGATALIRYARNRPQIATWINGLLARRPRGWSSSRWPTSWLKLLGLSWLAAKNIGVVRWASRNVYEPTIVGPNNLDGMAGAETT